MDSKETKHSKRSPHSPVIIFGILILFITIKFVLFASPFLFYFIDDRIKETRIRQEVETISGVKVKFVKTFEMYHVLQVEVENKGQITFHVWEDGRYGLNRLIQIDSIGPYQTSFLCVTVGSDGTINQEGHEGLFFGNPSYFRKWFPFEVNNERDLVDKYDAIINVLKTFPVKPTMEIYYDKEHWSRGKFVNELNPDYVSYTNGRLQQIYCDISLKQ